MKNGSGDYDIDIIGHIQTGDNTWVVEWALVWRRGDGWVGSPTNATELRVTVTGRGRGARTWDVEVDVLSSDVPADVYAKLRDYAIEEEQRSFEMAEAA